jgi:phosphatidylglycerol:prolipoprotein diacylglycerol transferase
MIPPRVYYSSFMFAALAVFLLARWWLPRPAALMRVPLWKHAALGLAAFIGGALGAKLPFALANPAGFFDASAWFTDGKTVVAGLIGAYLAVEAVKWVLDVRVKTGDTFAVPLALALAVGRWGCFFNGCCYGTETTLPWGVYFRVADGDDWRWARCHPTQIYESLFHFTMALILLTLMRRGLFVRQRLKLYLIAYGIYRFATEYIRPEPAWWLGLTFYQWASVALAAGLAVQWWWDRKPAARDDAVGAAEPAGLEASGAA